MSELTLDERCALTRRILSLLEGWNLGASDILALLQLPASIKARNLSRYRDEECFPDDPQVNRRLSYLVRIEDALHTYFPRNPEMRHLWVKRANKTVQQTRADRRDGRGRRERADLRSLASGLHLRVGHDGVEGRIRQGLTHRLCRLVD